MKLRRAGWLRGFRVDGVDEPRISAYKVASYVDGALPFIEDSDTSNLVTNTIISTNKRELNYFHRGWSLGATRTISPWTSSRIAANDQPNPEGMWFTRMTKTKRVKLEVLLEDLIPAPEFAASIEEALGHPTTAEKYLGLNSNAKLLHRGDVLPLEIEIGSSIALSSADLKSVQSSEIKENEFVNISQFSTTKDTIVAITGADLNLTYNQWATINDLTSNTLWQRIAVNKVISTIDLLPSHLRTQLSELYAQRACYIPPCVVGPVHTSYKAYDDTKHASRIISSIKIRCSYFIEILAITYSDGVTTTKHGGGGHVGSEFEFTLATDEHITEMLIWIEGEWLFGLQFVTNTGRCSGQYGIHYGPPIVARCKGGVLVGFLSHTKLHPEYKEMYHNVQGIWRRDLISKVPKEDDIYSDYFGDKGRSHGRTFNDRVFVGNSTSIRISSVEVWSGEFIDRIQVCHYRYSFVHGHSPKETLLPYKFTYTETADGQESTSTARHGGPGGSYHRFALENGEQVVTVSGRHEATCITQLCFVTNRGRTSEVFGGGRGQSFSALAPRDNDGNYFRLQYICGKSNDVSLTGIMFVWTPC
ncbi:unnamed protein product [Rhizoctonia solani]|uniref:Jacalin-type lectin domain-containing protein n=1 Tax=Rhizoctonia solani TaxID=456999 RepID=A0A8H3E6D1_9AGAM|nr:unnamed protein product [Rhizoctonia solani]